MCTTQSQRIPDRLDVNVLVQTGDDDQVFGDGLCQDRIITKNVDAHKRNVSGIFGRIGDVHPGLKRETMGTRIENLQVRHGGLGPAREAANGC